MRSARLWTPVNRMATFLLCWVTEVSARPLQSALPPRGQLQANCTAAVVTVAIVIVVPVVVAVVVVVVVVIVVAVVVAAVVAAAVVVVTVDVDVVCSFSSNYPTTNTMLAVVTSCMRIHSLATIVHSLTCPYLPNHPCTPGYTLITLSDIHTHTHTLFLVYSTPVCVHLHVIMSLPSPSYYTLACSA